jgi:N-acetylglucosaminyldiphosphoundecaprenol N-acetyl-beta-D-mannosaminyltransferase
MLETIDVLDVPLYAGDMEKACQHISDLSGQDLRSNYCVSATGAHGIVHARKDSTFKSILRSFYLNLPDGMPGVWIGHLKGAEEMKRCYGPDFFREILTQTADKPITHFFCGGNTGIADELREAVKIKFGNKNVVGTFCPPFLGVNQYDYASIAERINETKPNIVWIGLSTPKQEYFAYRLMKFTNVNFIITVGAAFDFHTDKITQAPSIVQDLGLEWFFRLLMEPNRLFKRYLEIVPLFIYYNALEFLSFAVAKFRKKVK